MTRKSRINYLKAISHNVEKKKMYKAKKQWVVAGLSFLVATGLGAFGSRLTTHADVNQTSTQTQKQPAPSSSASSGSSTTKPVQSASTKLDTVQSSATNMYRGLMLKAVTESKNLNTQQQSVYGSNNVNNSTKSKVNQVSGKDKNNIDSTEVTDNTSTSGSNQTSTKSGDQVSSTKSDVNSNSSSNSNNIPSSAPIHQKGSFNSAYQSMMAQMSGIDSEITGANTTSTDSNSNKNEDNKVVLRGTAQSDYFSGSVTNTGNDDGLNYKVWSNGGVEFTGGTANSNLSGFSSDNQDVKNARAVKFDNSIDTSHVTNMSDMFHHVNSFNINLGGSFNTSNVSNMSNMFSEDSNLKNLDLSQCYFNTSNVSDMGDMFADTPLINLNLGPYFDNRKSLRYYMLGGLDVGPYRTLQRLIIKSPYTIISNTSLNMMYKINGNDISTTAMNLSDGKSHVGIWAAQINNNVQYCNSITSYDINILSSDNFSGANGTPLNYIINIPKGYHNINKSSLTYSGYINSSDNFVSDTYNVLIAPNTVNLVFSNGTTKQVDTSNCISDNYTITKNDLPNNYHLTQGNQVSLNDVSNGGTINVSVAPNYDFGSAVTQANSYNNSIPSVNNTSATSIYDKASGYAQDTAPDTNPTDLITQFTNTSNAYSTFTTDSSLAQSAKTQASNYAQAVANDSNAQNETNASNDLVQASNYASTATSYANKANNDINSLHDGTTPNVYNFTSASNQANSIKQASPNYTQVNQISNVAQSYASSANVDTNSSAIINQHNTDNGVLNQLNTISEKITSANSNTNTYIGQLRNAIQARNYKSASADLNSAVSANNVANSLSNNDFATEAGSMTDSTSASIFNFASVDNEAKDISSVVVNSTDAINKSKAASNENDSASADNNSSAISSQNTKDNGIYAQISSLASQVTSANNLANSYIGDVHNDSKSSNISAINADLAHAQAAHGNANTLNSSLNDEAKNMSDSVSASIYDFSGAIASAQSIESNESTASSDGAGSISNVASGYAASASQNVNSGALISQSSEDHSTSSLISGLISQVNSANTLANIWASKAISDANKKSNAESVSNELNNATTIEKNLTDSLKAQTSIDSYVSHNMNDLITPINLSSANSVESEVNSSASSAGSSFSAIQSDSNSASSYSNDASKAYNSAKSNDDSSALSSLNALDSKYSQDISNESSLASQDSSLASEDAKDVSNDYSKFDNSNNASSLADSHANADSINATSESNLASQASSKASSDLASMKFISNQISNDTDLTSASIEAHSASSSASSESTVVSNDSNSAYSFSSTAASENKALNSTTSASISYQSSKDNSLSAKISQDSSSATSASTKARLESSSINTYASEMSTGSLTNVTSSISSAASYDASIADSASSVALTLQSDASKEASQLTSTNFSALYSESVQASYDNSVTSLNFSNANSVSAIASNYASSYSKDLNGRQINYQHTTDTTFNSELSNANSSASYYNSLVASASKQANIDTNSNNVSAINADESNASKNASLATQYLNSANADYALVTDMTKPVTKKTIIDSDIKDINNENSSASSFTGGSDSYASDIISADKSTISSDESTAIQDSEIVDMSGANSVRAIADSAYANASAENMDYQNIASDHINKAIGVGSLHLVYNIHQGSDNGPIIATRTKTIYIPIDKKLNSDSLIINPWIYTKPYYDQHNNNWTISFNSDEFKGFNPNGQYNNLNYNPTNTFTYNATQAGPITVEYKDSDANLGSQKIIDIHGLVGQNITLSTPEMGSTNKDIFGELKVPDGYHLANQLNTITLTNPSSATANTPTQLKNAPVGMILTVEIRKNKPTNNSASASVTPVPASNVVSNETSNNGQPASVMPMITPTKIDTNTPQSNQSQNSTTSADISSNLADVLQKQGNSQLQQISSNAHHELKHMMHHNSAKFTPDNDVFYAKIHQLRASRTKLPRVWTIHQLNKVGRNHTVRFGRVIVTSLSCRHSYEFRILKHVYLHKKIYFTHGKFHSLKPSHKALRINRIFLVHQGRHTYIRLELRLNHHAYFITGKKHYVQGLHR